jgi:hypothetical protein
MKFNQSIVLAAICAIAMSNASIIQRGGKGASKAGKNAAKDHMLIWQEPVSDYDRKHGHNLTIFIAVDNYYKLTVNGKVIAKTTAKDMGKGGSFDQFNPVGKYTLFPKGNGPWLIAVEGEDAEKKFSGGNLVGFMGAVWFDGKLIATTGKPGASHTFKMTRDAPKSGWDTLPAYDDSKWLTSNSMVCNQRQLAFWGTWITKFAKASGIHALPIWTKQCQDIVPNYFRLVINGQKPAVSVTPVIPPVPYTTSSLIASTVPYKTETVSHTPYKTEAVSHTPYKTETVSHTPYKTEEVSHAPTTTKEAYVEPIVYTTSSTPCKAAQATVKAH